MQNQKCRSESESNQNQAIVGLGRFHIALCYAFQFFRQCFLNQDLLRLCPREFPLCYLWDPRSFVPRCHAPVLSTPKPRLRSLFLRRINQYLIFLATLSRSCDRRGSSWGGYPVQGVSGGLLGCGGGLPGRLRCRDYSPTLRYYSAYVKII
jgi:hypothetical protein